MSVKKKRGGASTHVGQSGRAITGRVGSYGLAKQHHTAPVERPMNDITDDEIRKFLAPVRVDRLIDLIKERIVKENGREIVEFLALKGEREKPRIENASGPSLSTEEAGEVLSKSSETVRNHIKKNLLVGYTAANDQTKVRLPRWQFDGSKVYEWVPRLIEAFGENGWPLLNFVTVLRERLGKSYLDLLQAGEVDKVVAAAKRANPD